MPRRLPDPKLLKDTFQEGKPIDFALYQAFSNELRTNRLLEMATNSLPDPPAQLKAIQSHMRIASDIERVDPIVSYWVRLYSTESILKIGRDSPDCKTFLGAVIVWLENFKQTHKDNEAVTNETVGQAHMENFVVALFNKADTLDRNGTANKNTVRMFYMAAVLFEAMAVFGPLTDEISKRAKYAKFKAAYIQKCLKTGQVPKPGPIEGDDLEASSQDPSANDGQPTLPQDSADETSNNANRIPNPGSSDPFILTPGSPPKPPVIRPQIPLSPPQIPPSPPQVKVPLPSSNSSYSTTNTSTTTTTGSINSTRFQATNGAPLNAEDILKGQKFCKFANSALQYDDIPTAVANLEKALRLFTTGQRSD